MAKTRVPSIPNPNSIKDPTIRALAVAMKEALDVGLGRRGDELDRAATLRDLQDAGVISTGASGGKIYTITGTPQTPLIDLSKPPVATSLTASGGFTQIFLEWDFPKYSNYGYTEIWRNTVDDLGTAQLVGVSSAKVYSDPVETASTFYYWIRLISEAGIAGDYNATAGTSAATAIPVADVLSALEGQVTETHLHTTLTTRLDNNDTAVSTLNTNVGTLQTDVGTLQTNVSTISTDVLANAGDITVLETTVNHPTTGVAANSSAISALDSRVTTAEGSITTNATAITSLQTDLGTANGNISGNSTAIGLIDTRVTTAEGTITSQGTAITQLQTDVTAAQSTADGAVTTSTSNTTAISGLDTRVTAAEGTITTHTSDISSLNTAVATAQSTADGAVTSASTNATAISGLDTRVTTAEGSISTHTSDITSLNTAVSTAQTTADGAVTTSNANATAISGLDTRVTAAEGTITSTASDVTLLQVNAGRGTDPSNYIYNGTIDQIAADGRPAGIIASYGGATAGDIAFVDTVNKRGLSLYSATDSSIGASFRAFKVIAGATYTFRVRAKANNAVASGFYIRMYEYDSELTGTLQYISNGTAEGNAVTGTRYIGGMAENIALTTAYQDFEYTYTPTATAKWASPQILNWTGMGLAALHVESVSVTLAAAGGDVTAEAFTALETRVTTTENGIASAEAEYVVKTDVNGRVAGIGLLNDGVVSNFEVVADNFSIFHPSATQSLVFGVSGGNTVMNGAYIEDATITSAKIGSITSDKISTANLAALSADLGSVTAGSLSSPDGKVNINLSTGVFDVKSGTSGARLEIKENVIKVYDASGVLRVKMGDLSA